MNPREDCRMREPGQKIFTFDLQIHNFILAQWNTITRDEVRRMPRLFACDQFFDFIFATALSFHQFLEGFFKFVYRLLMHSFIVPNCPRVSNRTTIVTSATVSCRHVSHCTIVTVHRSCITNTIEFSRISEPLLMFLFTLYQLIRTMFTFFLWSAVADARLCAFRFSRFSKPRIFSHYLFAGKIVAMQSVVF